MPRRVLARFVLLLGWVVSRLWGVPKRLSPKQRSVCAHRPLYFLTFNNFAARRNAENPAFAAPHV